MVSNYLIILKFKTHLGQAAQTAFQSEHQYVRLDGSLLTLPFGWDLCSISHYIVRSGVLDRFTIIRSSLLCSSKLQLHLL